MSDAAEKTLYRTAALIFEELSFILPSPVTRPIGDVPAAGASVRFTGAFSGALVVRITRDLMPILSANMMGDDEPPDERLQRDAVGEIANVICGNVLPKIAATDEPFHLETPQYFEDALPAGFDPSLTLKAEIHIGLDSGNADVMLYTAGDAAPRPA